MTLKDVTVKKFIHLFDIQKADFYDTDVDKEIALLSCLFDKSEDYFLSMDWKTYRKWQDKLSFLNLENIEGKPQRFLKANGKVYAPIFEFNKLTAGQLIDIIHFTKEPEEIIFNLPKILASFCVPTKKTLFGRKLLPYMSTPHPEVASDMESANILEAYEVSVFFYNVWNAFLTNSGGCLVKEIIRKKKIAKTKITPMEQAVLLDILQKYGDGITARKG